MNKLCNSDKIYTTMPKFESIWSQSNIIHPTQYIGQLSHLILWCTNQTTAVAQTSGRKNTCHTQLHEFVVSICYSAEPAIRNKSYIYDLEQSDETERREKCSVVFDVRCFAIGNEIIWTHWRCDVRDTLVTISLARIEDMGCVCSIYPKNVSVFVWPTTFSTWQSTTITN